MVIRVLRESARLAVNIKISFDTPVTIDFTNVLLKALKKHVIIRPASIARVMVNTIPSNGDTCLCRRLLLRIETQDSATTIDMVQQIVNTQLRAAAALATVSQISKTFNNN